MTRLVQRLQWLAFALLLGALACITSVSDRRLELPRTPGPLHLAQLWWSPEAASHGVHTLHGRVVNTTDSTWENVQVSLDFQNERGESLFVRTVVLGRVRPGEPTEFSTGGLPKRTYHVAPLAITGTLPGPGPINIDTPLRPAVPGTVARTHRRGRTRRRQGRRQVCCMPRSNPLLWSASTAARRPPCGHCASAA